MTLSPTGSLLAVALLLAGCAMGDPAPVAGAGREAPKAVDATVPADTRDPATVATASAALAAPQPDPVPVAPPIRRSGPSAAACAEVTQQGPAKEIDLDTVRLALRGTDYRRGSFETNDAYRRRVVTRLEAVEAMITARTGRSELVFSIKIPDYRLAYDPETRALAIGSDLGLLRGGSAIGMSDFILVSSSERQIGTERRAIGYGARANPAANQRDIARFTGNQLGLIVPGATSIGWPVSLTKLHVPMTAAEAARAKQDLAVLFVGRLQEPYFAVGEFLQEPKVDEPVEKRLTVEAIRIVVDCAALYDRASGRVLRPLVPAG